LPRGSRLNEVMGKIRQRRLAASFAELLEGFADAPVQARPARRRQFIVERLAHQRVGEGEPFLRTRYRSDRMRADCLVDHVQQRIFIGALEHREKRKIEIATDNRRHRHHAAACVSQPGQAVTDDVFDTLRHTDCGQALDVSKHTECSGSDQMTDDFADEQAIAAGALRHDSPDQRRSVGAADRRDELHHRRFVESAHRQLCDSGVTAQFGE